MLKQTR